MERIGKEMLETMKELEKVLEHAKEAIETFRIVLEAEYGNDTRYIG